MFAAPSYIEKNGVPVNVEQLTDYDCLINIKDSPDLCWEFNENYKIRVNARYITDSTVSLVKPAIDGLGIIYVSKEMVQQDLDNGSLVEIKLLTNLTPLSFYIYHKPVNKSSIVRLLSDFLYPLDRAGCLKNWQNIIILVIIQKAYK